VSPFFAALESACFTLGGLVAGEGSFLVTRRLPPFADGTERRRFVFAIAMADRDRTVIEVLRAFVGGGSIRTEPPRREGWQPTCTLSIGSNRQHLRTTIPFYDRYLVTSAKREQYLDWKAELLDYLRAHPTQWGKGPSPCRICGKPVRGRGLCRSHYYEETGY
jgi:hypothetical protein